jgi:formylglycine-generating enzyme required for sulfatase activity
MKKLLASLTWFLLAININAQKLSEPMITIPEGEVLIDGRIFTIGTFQISRFELTAGTAALLLNIAIEKGDFIYPPDRDGQIRLKSTGMVLIDMSHKSSPLIFRNKKVFVRDGQENLPLVCVSKSGAMLLCNILSEKDNLQPCYNLDTGECYWHHNGYRLPTRAEWSRSHQLNDLSVTKQSLKENAWYFGNFFETGHSPFADNYSHPVGTRLSGAMGIHDLLGNAEEWCWDKPWIDPEALPQKDPKGPGEGTLGCSIGGSWDSGEQFLIGNDTLRVQNPWTISSRTGFRVTRTRGGFEP